MNAKPDLLIPAGAALVLLITVGMFVSDRLNKPPEQSILPRIHATTPEERIAEFRKQVFIEIDGSNSWDLMASNHDYWEKLIGKTVAVRSVIQNIKGGPVIGTAKGTLHLEERDSRDYGKPVLVIGVLRKRYPLGLLTAADIEAREKNLELQRKEAELRRKSRETNPTSKNNKYHRTDYDDDAILEYSASLGAVPQGMNEKTANTYFRLEDVKVIHLDK